MKRPIGSEGYYALMQYMRPNDWDKVFKSRFEIWKLGEAIESTGVRTGRLIEDVAKEYYNLYLKGVR